jgi:hypothetical protein
MLQCGAVSPRISQWVPSVSPSPILGEIVAQTARQAGEAQVVFSPGLGNTAVVFAALKSGAIDIYPEYSGTIAYELLGGKIRHSCCRYQPRAGAERARGADSPRFQQYLCAAMRGGAATRASSGISISPSDGALCRAFAGIPERVDADGRAPRL